jgi:hypothetical protein
LTDPPTLRLLEFSEQNSSAGEEQKNELSKWFECKENLFLKLNGPVLGAEILFSIFHAD